MVRWGLFWGPLVMEKPIYPYTMIAVPIVEAASAPGLVTLDRLG